MYNEYPSCESLWLSPCPLCSWIALWRRPELDVLDKPGFFLARHSTAKYGVNHWMLRGCSHANVISEKAGPRVNRLKLAVAWRRKCAEIFETCFRRGYTDAQRADIAVRLSHPEVTMVDGDVVPVKAPQLAAHPSFAGYKRHWSEPKEDA